MDEKYSKEELTQVRARITTIIEQCEAGHKSNFAKKIKHSSGNIESWLNPKYSTMPSFKALRNIAKEYQVNLNWLVTGEGQIYQTEKDRIDMSIDQMNARIEKIEKFILKSKK